MSRVSRKKTHTFMGIIIIIIVQQFQLGWDCFGNLNNFENLAQCQLHESNCTNMHGLGIKMVDVKCLVYDFRGEV